MFSIPSFSYIQHDQPWRWGLAAWEDISHCVNAGANSWKAAVPDKFKSVEDVKPFLGAFLTGDPQCEAPAVKDTLTNTEVPESFDSAETWPQCAVISIVRVQSSCGSGSCWVFGSVSSFESLSCTTTQKDVKYSPVHFALMPGCMGGNSALGYVERSGVSVDVLPTQLGSVEKHKF